MYISCLFKHGRTVMALFLFLVTIDYSASADQVFLEQPIGSSVRYFEPVDIDDDGIWELALQVTASGDWVGVYSPSRKRWIDGPHYLPTHGIQWGCADIEGDGQIEYAYLSGQSVRICDPWESTDSTILSVYFTPHTMQVWGKSRYGDPVVYLSEHIVRQYTSPYPGIYEGDSYARWHMYSLSTGQSYGYRGGWIQKGPVCFVKGMETNAYICIYDHKDGYRERAGAVYDDWSYNSVHIIDEFSNIITTSILPEYPDPLPWWPMWFDNWFIDMPLITLGQWINPGVPELAWVLDYQMLASEASLLGAYSDLDIGQRWTTQTNFNEYVGMAYHDWDGDATGELILPFADRDVWQLRDPQTGLVIDSIVGMPPVNLRTAPIMEPDVLDLYYFQDSTLYILDRPGMPTDVFGDENEASVPSAFTLRQNYPNPFNTSTVIEFSLEQDGDVNLEVFNILGQKVAALVNERLPSGIHRVSWDGKDQSGVIVPSGIYFYRLITGEQTAIHKMSLLK